MDKVISSYLLAIDELNMLIAISYRTATAEDTTARIAQIADDVLSFLIKAYTLGVQNASIMLGYDLSVDLDAMEDAIYLLIDGKTFEDRVADHVGNNSLGGLQTLVESEFHRVYNRAVDDGGRKYIDNGNTGVTKIWYTELDEKVRGTHAYLEKTSVPFEREFFTYDGDHAAYPGGFEKVENNANCRCIVILIPDE